MLHARNHCLQGGSARKNKSRISKIQSLHSKVGIPRSNSRILLHHLHSGHASLEFSFWNLELASYDMPIRILALDIGTARTGVAFGELPSGIVMAFETVKHKTFDELASQIEKITLEKKIDQCVIGLPLLLGGEEGNQVALVKLAVECIKRKVDIAVEYLDERYTTNSRKMAHKADPDAESACQILLVWMERKKTLDK